MRGAVVSRLTTGTLALLLAGSIGYGVHVGHRADDADAWRAEAAGWQAIASDVSTANRRVVRQNRQIVRRYNQLVEDIQVDPQSAAVEAASQVAVEPIRIAEAAVAVPAVEPSVAQEPTSQAS